MRNGNGAGHRPDPVSRIIEDLAAEETGLRVRARELLGVTGRRERIGWPGAVRASGTGWYPLVALCALAFADAGVTAAVRLAVPGIRSSMGRGTLGSLTTFEPPFFVAGALAAIVVLARRPARARAARLAVATAGVAAVLVAASTSSVAVLFAALAGAVASGVSTVVLVPLAFDLCRPPVRVRAVSALVAAVTGGFAAANLVKAIGLGAGWTWRTDVLVAGIIALAATAVAARLPNPEVGRFDRDRVRRLVEDRIGGRCAQGEGTAHPLSLAEQFRRVTAAPSSAALLLLAGAYGLFARALPLFLDELLRDRWAMVTPSRALTSALVIAAGIPGVALFARRAEPGFRASPSRFLRTATVTTVATAIALGGAAATPVFGVAVLLLAAASAGFAAMLATALVGLPALTEPARRGHATALLGTSVLVGGVIGQVALTTIGSRFGVAWAVLTAAAIVVGAASLLGRAVGDVDGDLDGLVGRMIETDELAVRVGQGQHLPLLSCRHVDFSYGQVQVLFDVSVSVDDGEMVALLGTNGAGKSTLLRVISGLEVPSAGSIHYRGADITFVDTDRRVQLGITQVPGGRATFGPMTVVDNLRAFGHTHGRDRARLERGIDEAFAAFPALAARRDQMASTLSGGEQQMLAVSAAFIMQPRLLLIDELSLGLAPMVVGQLLEMVRRINERGTAVVLVEQSVNIALSVVDHAYFMEKGQVRFDGSAAELLGRPDLLRSVFLQGATAGVGLGSRR